MLVNTLILIICGMYASLASAWALPEEHWEEIKARVAADEAPYEPQMHLPENQRVVNMTGQMYNDLFVDPLTMQVKEHEEWFLTFARVHNATMEHSSYAAKMDKILAEDFNGTVRFGIVNTIEEEGLVESYNVQTVPTNLYIKDGMFYQMQSLAISYGNVEEFIKGNGYQNSSQVYDSATLRWQTPSWLLWTRYIQREVCTQVYVNFLFITYRDTQEIKEFDRDYLGYFISNQFNTKSKRVQFNEFFAAFCVTCLILLLILYKLVKCMCRCCCSKQCICCRCCCGKKQTDQSIQEQSDATKDKQD